ncbi:MAG: hypothetical protein IJR14_10860 [Synergistaceae bacterium]|nr:hypothetical protein [Synergistaceae bacterium]
MKKRDRIIAAFYSPYRGAGKSTAAALLRGIIFGMVRGHGICGDSAESFACPIRMCVAGILSHVTPRRRRQGKDEPIAELGGATERDLMLAIGQAGRGVYTDIWADVVRRAIRKNPDVDFVIDDLRFPNEYAMLREEGAKIIRIVVPGREPEEAEAEGLLEGREPDAEIVNEMGGLEKLTDVLEDMARRLWPERFER